MNDKQQLTGDFLSVANRLRGMIAFAEYVQSLGNLEQHEAELQKLVKQHETGLADLRDQHQKAKDKTQEESAISQRIREQAHSDSESCLKSAAATANQKLMDAEKQTLDILAQGSLKIKEVAAKVLAGETRLVELQKDIAVKEFKLKALRDEMTELARKHLG